MARIEVCSIDVTVDQLLSLGSDERFRSIVDALRAENVGGRLCASVDESGRLHIEFDAHGAARPLEPVPCQIERPQVELETTNLRLTVDPPETPIVCPTEAELLQYGVALEEDESVDPV